MTELPESFWQETAAGGSVDGVSMSLRVFGPELDPDEVSRLMGCAPSDSHRAGDPFPGGRGRRSQGIWLLRSTIGRAETLDAHLDQLLGGVTADPLVWSRLHRSYTADVFCGLFLRSWNRGAELSAQSARLLADRGLPIGFDIYTGLDDPAEPS